MAGILNSKERMIDFLITEAGKRQIFDGRMKIEFATVTDRHTFYRSTGSLDPDVAEDPSNRVFFEPTRLSTDTIVPELDPGFNIVPFRAGDLVVEGKRIVSGTFIQSGSSLSHPIEVTGSDIPFNISNKLLPGLTNNFRNLKILSTKDRFSDTSGFSLSAHTGSFVITNSSLDFPGLVGVDFIDSPYYEAKTDNLPSIYADYHFSHLPNFKFLPPENTPDSPDQDTGTPLGNYPALTTSPAEEIQNIEGLENHLKDRQSITINFSEKSKDNNLIGQIFALNTGSTTRPLEKLVIIDYGELDYAQGVDFENIDRPGPFHVYFVGRMAIDNSGAHVFINLFTLVFE